MEGASREKSPLVLGNIYFMRPSEKEVYGLSVRCSSSPSTLLSLVEYLASNGVRIISASYTRRDDSSEMFLVVSLEGARLPPPTIVDGISRIDGVDRVDLVRPQLEGLILDLDRFPITDNTGRRYILISDEYMGSLVAGTRERFGTAGEAFLYYEGLMAGRIIAERCRSLGITSLADGLKYLLMKKLTLGRWLGELVEFGERRIRIRMYGNWECEMARRRGISGAASHFERGSVAGLIEGLTGKRVLVREVKCVAKGDPYCELEVLIQG